MLLSAMVALALAAADAGSGHAQADGTPLLPPVRDTAGVALQAHFGTLEDELTRVLEIMDPTGRSTRLVRRLPSPDGPPEGLDLRVLPAEVRLVGNSGHPAGGNDGLLWAGRGVSTLIRAGVAARWGPVSVGLAPEVAWQQNADFDIRAVSRAGTSPYVYPFLAIIDLPQRFGPDPFVSVAPGQSYARVDAAGFAAGVSTENVWWGPATRYPLLMSNNAPGFPHVFAGTGRQVGVGIGTVEAELVWGRLRESDYFDENPNNDVTGLAGLVASFSPYLLPGLSMGFARVYHHQESEGEWLRDPSPLLETFGLAGENGTGNELFSLFGRWVFPGAGAEIYGEWGRDDRWVDWRELIQEPDHSQAYMLGFQKVTAVGEETALRVHMELTALQELGELRSGSRPLPVWYTHHQVIQGYTNRGQLLGAWIGPGSDAQFLAVDAIVPWGMWGGYIERVRRSDATAAALAARRWSPYEHDTELTVAGRALFFPLPGLSAAVTLSWGHRFNRDFLEDSGNLGFDLNLSWAPPASTHR